MKDRSALEVFAVFTRLGLTSFGGPVAHLGYFRNEFVVRRGWFSEEAFADLVALCQFLPGPASSQAGFAIGLHRAGLAGGIAAFAGFTAPSAVLMIAAALGAITLPAHLVVGVVHGLMLVAVAVVAHAVVGMAVRLCRGVAVAVIAVAAAAVVAVSGAAWMQPMVILAGGLAGLALPVGVPGADVGAFAAIGRRTAIVAGAMFAALLVGLPVLAAVDPQPAVQVFDAFYRSGAMVFGGGHVVLPLLEAETVGRGWVDAETFLAGYGAAQALPGPLFSFAAFLGASADTGLPSLAGGLVALGAIFLPGLLLVTAALPYWQGIKRWPLAGGFIRGANASVVGVLAAALWNPVGASAILGWPDLLVAGAGFAALQVLRAPALLVVAGVAAAGAGLTLLG